MRLQYLLPQLLLPLVDISVELVAVFANGELLIVVNGNVYLFTAHGLVLWVVELGNVGMSQSLLSSESLVWIKL